jgi:hypothetical protein
LPPASSKIGARAYAISRGASERASDDEYGVAEQAPKKATPREPKVSDRGRGRAEPRPASKEFFCARQGMGRKKERRGCE